MRPRRLGGQELTNRTLVRDSTSRIGSASFRGPSDHFSEREGQCLEVRPGNITRTSSQYRQGAGTQETVMAAPARTAQCRTLHRQAAPA